MTNDSIPFLTVFTFASLLAGIVLSFFTANRVLIYGLLALSFSAAWSQSLIEISGLIVSILFLTTAEVLAQREKVNRFYALPAEGVMTLMGLLLLIHALPGFHGFQFMDGYQIHPQSVPYSLFFHIDKPLVAIALLMLLPSAEKTLLPDARKGIQTLIATMAFIFILLGAAVGLGALKFEPKYQPWFAVWILNNLFFVCVPEELLFRGFLQRNMTLRLKNFRFGPPLAILLTSLLFAVIHIPSGGLLLAGFSFVAGLAYGAVYFRTGSILSAILAHFLLNLMHLLLFTYPSLLK